MTIRKNSAVIAVVVLLLCVAVYLNWSYSRGLEGDMPVADGLDLDAGLTAADISDSERLEANQYDMDTGTEASAKDGEDASAADGEALGDSYVVLDERTAKLSSYFDEARLSRQQSRDEALSILRATVSDANSSKEAKAEAESKIASIAANAVKESRIENLVMAKGFLACVAMVDESGVNVVLLPEEEGLQSSDVAKVKDIVISESSVTADKIKIIEAQ